MANPLSAMLDELMGRNRNALPSENAKDIRWDDEEVRICLIIFFKKNVLY